MAKHNDTGKLGEKHARDYLDGQGYEILDTNWRSGHKEVDIIAFKDGVIVFIEVKTRTDTDFGDPESFVDRAKQRSYVRLANAYILQHDRSEEVRFDIIAVTLADDNVIINHIENAFSTIDTRR